MFMFFFFLKFLQIFLLTKIGFAKKITKQNTILTLKVKFFLQINSYAQTITITAN